MDSGFIALFHLTLLSITRPGESVNSTDRGYHWGRWSSLPLSCSVTCGRGLRCRVRKCLDGFGNEQPFLQRCHKPEDYSVKAEWCTICVVNAECSRSPGWGAWGGWTKCIPTKNSVKKPDERCQLGIRARYRKCDSPPPQPPPNRVACSGYNQQTSECSFDCDQKPFDEPKNVVQQIGIRVEMDHRKGLQMFHQVIRRTRGEQVRMSCATPAYKLAKRLTVGQEFSTETAKGWETKQMRISWYKNGQRIDRIQPESWMRNVYTALHAKGKLQATRVSPMMEEQRRWEALKTASTPQIKDNELIFESIVEGDQGFYSCELEYEDERWTAIFYSLIVADVQYLAQATDPFYLHSNLGFENALRDAPVWLEASQIVWKRNGMEQSRGLVARGSRRIQLIGHLNQTHNGMWLCYLIVPASGPPSRLSTPWIRVSGTYLLAEFQLRVDTRTNSLWQLGANPDSIRKLRNLVTALTLLGEVLFLFLLLTIWATQRWIDRAMTQIQQKAIVHELVDNHCRLMLTARKRAKINRDRLLPLMIQDQKRLERASNRLTDRYIDAADLEEDAQGEQGGSVWNRMSKLGSKINRFSKVFRKGSSIKAGKASLMSSDSATTGEDKERRVSKLRKMFGGSTEMNKQTGGTVAGGKTPKKQNRVSDVSRPSMHSLPSNYTGSLLELPRYSQMTGESGVSEASKVSNQAQQGKASSNERKSHSNEPMLRKSNM